LRKQQDKLSIVLGKLSQQTVRSLYDICLSARFNHLYGYLTMYQFEVWKINIAMIRDVHD